MWIKIGRESDKMLSKVTLPIRVLMKPNTVSVRIRTEVVMGMRAMDSNSVRSSSEHLYLYSVSTRLGQGDIQNL